VKLAGKICLIAGASGAIGSAVAQRFRAESARLALTYSRELPSNQTLERQTDSDSVLWLRLDVRRWPEVQQAVEAAVSRFGTIDVLVNCAGILGPVGPATEMSVEEWAQTVEVNLMGSFYLTRAVLKIMANNGGGKIIHFSGGGAAYGRPFFTAYGSSKAALVRFVESVADEVRENNIQINAIAPGPVHSRMWEELRLAGNSAGARALEELENMDKTGGVSAERAAALAAFLACGQSDGLTGRLISALHDPWESMEERIADIMRTEAGTLRRVPLT
jgi:NAD(P)-dependent dehydrogenase (short-subunit alcohol dehydrogenase family)